MIDHARREFPGEVCGFLAGRENDVIRIYRMNNAEKDGMRYSIPLREQFDAVRDIRSRDLEIIGVYHSHPNARPFPSSRDIRLALNPEYSYMIISITNGAPEIRSFKISGGVAQEEEIYVG